MSLNIEIDNPLVYVWDTLYKVKLAKENVDEKDKK